MGQCASCGKQNEDAATHCYGCGNPLPERGDNQVTLPSRKSKTIAVILALFFGPLGLLYLGLEGLVIIIFVFGLGFFLAPLLMGVKSGASIAIFGRVAAAIYAVNAVEKRNGDTKGSAINLLNEAARLESQNRLQAIAKYEEIKNLYPDSSASEEAERALKTLKSNSVE